MPSKGIKQLAKILLEIKEPKQLENFLENILTPSEHEEIAQRLQILSLLNEGETQREIAQKLQVSIGTVSRGSRILQYGKPGLDQVLQWWRSSSRQVRT